MLYVVSIVVVALYSVIWMIRSYDYIEGGLPGLIGRSIYDTFDEEVIIPMCFLLSIVTALALFLVALASPVIAVLLIFGEIIYDLVPGLRKFHAALTTEVEPKKVEVKSDKKAK